MWGGELYSLVQPRGAPSPATPRPFLRPLQGPAKPRGRRDRRCGVSSPVVQDRGSRARTHTHNHCSVLHSAGSRAPGSAPVGVSCASQGEPHPASDEQGSPPLAAAGRRLGVAGGGGSQAGVLQPRKVSQLAVFPRRALRVCCLCRGPSMSSELMVQPRAQPAAFEVIGPHDDSADPREQAGITGPFRLGDSCHIVTSATFAH